VGVAQGEEKKNNRKTVKYTKKIEREREREIETGTMGFLFGIANVRGRRFLVSPKKKLSPLTGAERNTP
jgi:hypothetical protein